MTVLAASQAVRDRVARMRRKVCEAAREAEEAAEGLDKDAYWRVFFLTGVETRTQPTFTFRGTSGGVDYYWYVQGNRLVSEKERRAILSAYEAAQQARGVGRGARAPADPEDGGD